MYGHVTLVSEVLSKRPDLFIPFSDLSSAVMFKPKFMDQKTMELAAIAAGSALGAEHCLMVHFKQAAKYGASEDEMFDADHGRSDDGDDRQPGCRLPEAGRVQGKPP